MTTTTTTTDDEIMDLAQIADACSEARVGAPAFWQEAMGGDMAPLPRGTVERIIGELAS